MQDIRTSSLFHYTSLACLKQILENGFYPNYCQETISSDRSLFCIGIPMVSFCDIPLTRVSNFTDHYGQYAIGLDKEYALSQGINPILYVVNADIISSLSFFKSAEMMTLKKLQECGGKKDSVQVDLTHQDSLNAIKYLVNYNNAHIANTTFFGYIKGYQGNPKHNDHCNYDENEWRYLVKENEQAGIPWFWDEESYNTWRGNGVKPKPTGALLKQKLTFDTQSISHIIVKEESEIKDMVSFIRNLNHIGGRYDKGISDNEKDLLYTKVISLERINKDF